MTAELIPGTNKFNNVTYDLAKFNETRLNPGEMFQNHIKEIDYVEAIRTKAVLPEVVTTEWFEHLLDEGPGQNHPLFQFLADDATEEQMKWFLLQEAAGEAGFDDLLAMTQVKMPIQAKLEMARNYWDEMGQGKEAEVHGTLLRSVVEHYGLEPTVGGTLPEPLMLNNLMTAFACNRRYAFQAVGALGVIEMTAPGRVSCVDRGLERLGVPKRIRKYFTVHATLDVKHSREWNREVVRSLELSHPERMREIGEGAYLRLWCGLQCFERYMAHYRAESPA